MNDLPGSALALVLALASISGAVRADFATIEHAEATPGSNGWRLAVTLRHPDTGWDHYADGWEVLDAAGNSLGLRVLAHPHVNEQPFTRMLSDVQVPAGTETVFIRARCSQDGWGERLFPVPVGN